MINFKQSDRCLNLETIVSKSISIVAKDHDLNKENVISEIGNQIRGALSTKEINYFLLTSASLKFTYPFKRITIDDCHIRIIKHQFPKKYQGRDQVIKSNNIEQKPIHNHYVKVIVGVKAKSANIAAAKGINALDIVRSVWSLFANSSMEMYGQEWEPINKIRLGVAHTIHSKNGTIASISVWYEPNFKLAILLNITDVGLFTSNSKWAFSRLEKSNYKSNLKESLVRYVRALDERDQNIALVKLWGALELLTSPGEANYNLITRRCSFLFKERDYHMQVLEHLREYRNCSIHAGNSGGNAKTYCFQLQFYFYHLVMFHLRNAEIFSNLQEANNFLDLPTSIEALGIRKRLIEKAINFVS